MALDGQSRAAADQRPHDRRRLWQPVALDLFDLETGGGDRGDRVAVAVTAVAEEAPGPLEAVLPAGEIGMVRADVLEEEHLAARLEDALNLQQCRRLVGNR